MRHFIRKESSILSVLFLSLLLNCSHGSRKTSDATETAQYTDLAGLYSYSYETESETACLGFECVTGYVKNSGVLFLDESANALLCLTNNQKRTETIYLDGEYDPYETIISDGDQSCSVGHYTLESSHDNQSEIQILFEKTAFTTDAYGETEQTLDVTIDNASATVSGLEMALQTTTNITADDFSDYQQLLQDDTVIIRNSSIFRLYSTIELAKAMVGAHYSENIGYDTSATDSVYNLIDTYTEYDEFEHESNASHLFATLKLSDDGTYQSCTIIDPRIYAHSGDWSVSWKNGKAQLELAPQKFGYEDHPSDASESAEITFTEDWTNTSLEIALIEQPGYDFYATDFRYSDDISDFSLNSNQTTLFTQCEDYLNGDSTENLVSTETEYAQELLTTYNEQLIGSYVVDGESSFSGYDEFGYYYDEEIDDYVYADDLYDSPHAALTIDENLQYELCLTYAGETYSERGTLSLTADDYEDREFTDETYDDEYAWLAEPTRTITHSGFGSIPTVRAQFTAKNEIDFLAMDFIAPVFEDLAEDYAVLLPRDSDEAAAIMQDCH